MICKSALPEFTNSPVAIAVQQAYSQPSRPGTDVDPDLSLVKSP